MPGYIGYEPEYDLGGFNYIENSRNSIVRSGLTLWLEASDRNSYPGSGNTWFDISRNGINAVGSSAISGGSLQDTQPYTTPVTSILDTDNHSIFFMLQISGTNGAWSKIFGYEANGSDRSPGIWRWPSGRRLHWRYNPNNSSADFSVDAIGDQLGTEFTPNTWYYVGVTKNGATATMYTNAVRLGSSAVSNPKDPGSAEIKLYPSYNQGTSKMGSVQIYNRALTDAEVAQNFSILRKRYGI